MQNRVMSSLLHMTLTDEKPCHYLCASGIDSWWCTYQRETAQVIPDSERTKRDPTHIISDKVVRDPHMSGGFND